MSRHPRTTTALTAALLAATACASRADVPPQERENDVVVLRVRTLAGMPGLRVAPVPDYSLYGDGTVIRPGPQRGSLLTATVSRLSSAQSDRLYQTAHDVGLDRNERYVDTGTTDTTIVRTTLRSGRTEHRTDLVAAGSLPGPTEVAEFVTSLRARVPSDRANELPTRRLAAVATHAHADDGTPSAGPSREWPFTPPGRGTPLTGGTCVILTGDDAATAAEWATTSDVGTVWSSHGVQYRMTFRPLLPDETDCSALDTR